MGVGCRRRRRRLRHQEFRTRRSRSAHRGQDDERMGTDTVSHHPQRVGGCRHEPRRLAAAAVVEFCPRPARLRITPPARGPCLADGDELSGELSVGPVGWVVARDQAGRSIRELRGSALNSQLASESSMHCRRNLRANILMIHTRCPPKGLRSRHSKITSKTQLLLVVLSHCFATSGRASLKNNSRKKPRRLRKSMKRKTTSLSNKDPFRLSCSQLAKIFLSYNPHDVLIALNSSDLWLPNIGSQVKHILAFSVFLSLKPLQFATNNRIEYYSSLVEFLGKVHGALPDFAMLEDYVPETDWGEIKIPSDKDVFRIFYGGSLERTPDYIDAFRLAHSAAPAPLRDIHLSIRLQDFIISKIDRSIVGDPSKAAPGHIELPSEQFWRDCRAALLATAEEPSWAEMSTDLIARLGSLTHPATHSQFADMIMAGRLPPATMIEIDLRRYPLSLRSAVAVVIDYWSAPGRPNAADADVTTSLGTFLRRRFSGPHRTGVSRIPACRRRERPVAASALSIPD